MWYHCPGQPGAREPTYEVDKRLDSWSFDSKQYLARIPTTAVHKVQQQAQAIPPQDCSSWALYVILRLEREGLIPAGNYENLRNRYGNSHNGEDLGPGNMRPGHIGHLAQQAQQVSRGPVLHPRQGHHGPVLLPGPVPRGRQSHRAPQTQQTQGPRLPQQPPPDWENRTLYQAPVDSKIQNWLDRM